MFQKAFLPERYENGYREYQLPSGLWVPSMTTVLGASNPDKDAGLQAWKDKVGEKEANKVTKRAAGHGEALHKAAEDYLDGLPVDLSNEPLTKSMFIPLKKELDRIYPLMTEVPLFSERLGIAGRTDCIGLWDYIDLSIIDFKNSRYMKTEEYVQDYYIQLTGYALMFADMTGTFIKKINIPMVSLTENHCKVFNKEITSDLMNETIKRIQLGKRNLKDAE